MDSLMLFSLLTGRPLLDGVPCWADHLPMRRAATCARRSLDLEALGDRWYDDGVEDRVDVDHVDRAAARRDDRLDQLELHRVRESLRSTVAADAGDRRSGR